MDDVGSRTSKLLLAHAALGAGVNLAWSAREGGAWRALGFFALATGLPAAGELLATGPLGLLRHRTRPRVLGVPLVILLLWHNAILGSHAVAEEALERLSLDEDEKRSVLPLAAALAGTSLDLILDPFGLDAGLWEWKTDSAYAVEIEGANGHRGVPLLNYLGWLALVAGAVAAHQRLSGDRPRRGAAGLVPALVLLPYYLAAAVWAVKTRRLRYLLYSSPFAAALYASLGRRAG